MQLRKRSEYLVFQSYKHRRSQATHVALSLKPFIPGQTVKVGGAAPNVCPSKHRHILPNNKKSTSRSLLPLGTTHHGPRRSSSKSTGRHRPMSDARDQRPPKKPAHPGAISHPVDGRRLRADALDRQQRLTAHWHWHAHIPCRPAASADRPRGSAHRLSPVDGARTTSAGMPAEYGQSPPSRQPRCGSVQYLREPKILADHRAA